MLEAKVSYYEYRKRGGVQITYDVKFGTPEDLAIFLDKVLGPVVAPPEVGEDGMLKEKKELT